MHGLEIIDGQAQMAWTADGDLPWHGLGVRVEEGISPEEMMKVAGLDWSVKKVPLNYQVNGDNFVAPDKQALIRETDGRMLSIVGKDWNPVQNLEAFKFFDEFCKEGQMQMHTAGSLFDGKRIWALAKVASDFTVFGDDRVEGYLLFSNPHEFGKCVDVRFTPIRVVCNNTLTMSLHSESSNFAKINHVNEFNPEEVKEMLGIASQTMDEYK